MGFLQRSKSEGVVVRKSRKQAQKVAELGDVFPTITEQAKKSTSQERPLTSDGGRSFSRPRTANAAMEHTYDLPRPGFKIDIKAGDEIFSFPTPSPRLQLPKSATFKPAQSRLSQLERPESPAIGIAIGSPGHARPNWGRSITADQVLERMPSRSPPPPPVLPDHPDIDVAIPAELRKKKSNWKGFSGLFGRKTSKTVEAPFYKLRLTPEKLDQITSRTAQTARDMVTPEPSPLPPRSPSAMELHHRRTPSINRGMARFESRVEAARASLMLDSSPRVLRSPSTIQKAGFSPMFQSLQRLSDEMGDADEEPRTDSPLSINEKIEELLLVVHAIPIPEPPKVDDRFKLDLDLPDPKFERYSIMFEKQLESRPSLLERRQSKLKRNQSVKKLDLGPSPTEEHPPPSLLSPTAVPSRGAPSPGIKRSLSTRFGQKVLTPVKERFSALHRPRPIQRSKTLPPNATSPLAQTFTKPTITVENNSPSGLTHIHEMSLPPTPMTMTTFSDSGSPALISAIRDVGQTEPSWDMVTSELAQLSPVLSPDPYLRVKSPEDLESRVVQVSVARQVSVAKAMQQVRQSITLNSRPKVVELSRHGRGTSTVVIVESVEE